MSVAALARAPVWIAIGIETLVNKRICTDVKTKFYNVYGRVVRQLLVVGLIDQAPDRDDNARATSVLTRCLR